MNGPQETKLWKKRSTKLARIQQYARPNPRPIDERFLYCHVRLDRNKKLDNTVRCMMTPILSQESPKPSTEINAIFTHPKGYQNRSILVSSPDSPAVAGPSRVQNKQVSFPGCDRLVQILNTTPTTSTLSDDDDEVTIDDCDLMESPTTNHSFCNESGSAVTSSIGLQLHQKLEHQRQQEHQLLQKHTKQLGNNIKNQLELQIHQLNQEMKLQLQQRKQQQHATTKIANKVKRKQLLRINLTALLHKKTKKTFDGRAKGSRGGSAEPSTLSSTERYGHKIFRSYVRLRKSDVDALRNVHVNVAEQMLIGEMRVAIKRHV